MNSNPMLTPESRQDLIARLRKIEGQTRGIQRMIDEERECREILNQLASVRAATQHVSRELIRGYLQGCLTGPNGGNDDQTLSDLVDLLMRA
ncbi:MAG: metal-sensitive transcriptional regulator [Anaerolineae bacterium]